MVAVRFRIRAHAEVITYCRCSAPGCGFMDRLAFRAAGPLCESQSRRQRFAPRTIAPLLLAMFAVLLVRRAPAETYSCPGDLHCYGIATWYLPQVGNSFLGQGRGRLQWPGSHGNPFLLGR
jgi:hypothetical protein